MKIAIATDAWTPQVNGVVRTLTALTADLRQRGHEVAVISPDLFRSFACPSYPEIRLALARPRSVGEVLDRFTPDAIHISTEGPIGLATRQHCLARRHPFTTAYHTQFPDYLAKRTGLPSAAFWPFIRWFHRPSAGIMVATDSVARQLQSHGLGQVRPWSRGVDMAQFRPDVLPPEPFLKLERPIQLYVGRVAVEKNIEAFLDARLPGTKVVVGDGPALARLSAAYPEAHFVGRQEGETLVSCYAGADVLVFPSRTDTFGLVMVEAMACGTPVAAYPVPGPLDVLDAASGAMESGLETAIARALTLGREGCLHRGRGFSWARSTDQFLAALEPQEVPPTIYAAVA